MFSAPHLLFNSLMQPLSRNVWRPLPYFIINQMKVEQDSRYNIVSSKVDVCACYNLAACVLPMGKCILEI